MEYTIEWHPRLKNVLVVTHHDMRTIDTLLESVRREAELIEEANTTVHTIYMVGKDAPVPKGFISNLPRFAEITNRIQNRNGLRILVGVTGIRRAFLDIASTLYQKLHMVDTMEEAETLIETAMSGKGE